MGAKVRMALAGLSLIALTASTLSLGVQQAVTSGQPTPDVAAIQAAYRVESAAGSPLHEQGLTILTAECAGGEPAEFICWIRYRTEASGSIPPEVRFDVVSLSRKESGWKLTSGLCVPPRP